MKFISNMFCYAFMFFLFLLHCVVTSNLYIFVFKYAIINANNGVDNCITTKTILNDHNAINIYYV